MISRTPEPRWGSNGCPSICGVPASYARAFSPDAGPLGNSPTEFVKLIEAEIPLWIEAVAIAGVKSE